MYAVQSDCALGTMYYLKTTDVGEKHDLIFAVDDARRWALLADKSVADERGFVWVQREYPWVRDLVGDLVGRETGYRSGLESVGEGWQLRDWEGDPVVLLAEKRVTAPLERDTEEGLASEDLVLKVVILPSGKKRDLRFYRGEDPLPDDSLRVIWTGYRVMVHPDRSVTLVGETHEVLSGDDARALAAYTERIGLKL